MDLNTELRYAGGPDNWKVRCEFGLSLVSMGQA